MEWVRWLKVVLLVCLLTVAGGRELKVRNNGDVSIYDPTLARILVEYASAVYMSDLTALITWTCDRCNGMTKGFEMIELIVDVQHCLQAYVGVAQDLNAIIIAFRGTQEHSGELTYEEHPMKNKLPSSWISALKKSLSPSKRPPSDSSKQQPKVQESVTTTTCLSFVQTSNKDMYCKCSTDDPLEQTLARSRMPFKKKLAATIRIQTVFRMYLARRALRSLKALVRLQALVRGCYVRKRTEVTLRCMVSLLRIQDRTRQQRLMNLRGVIQSEEKSKIEEFRSSADFTLRKSVPVDCKSNTDSHENRDLSIVDILASCYEHKELDQAFSIKFSHEVSGSSKGQSALVNGELLKGTINLNYGLNDDVAAKAAQLGRKNMTAEDMDFQPPSPLMSPMKIAKSMTPIRSQVWIDEYSTCTPRTPNYMAFTESAKAKVRHQGSIATKRVSPPSICSTSNSPRQVGLHVKSTLPPVRTGRSSDSPAESYGRGVTTSSVGEMRRYMRKRLEGRQSIQYTADLD